MPRVIVQALTLKYRKLTYMLYLLHVKGLGLYIQLFSYFMDSVVFFCIMCLIVFLTTFTAKRLFFKNFMRL